MLHVRHPSHRHAHRALCELDQRLDESRHVAAPSPGLRP